MKEHLVPKFQLRHSASEAFINPLLVVAVTGAGGDGYAVIRTIDGGLYEVHGAPDAVAAALWPYEMEED